MWSRAEISPKLRFIVSAALQKKLANVAFQKKVLALNQLYLHRIRAVLLAI